MISTKKSLKRSAATAQLGNVEINSTDGATHKKMKCCKRCRKGSCSLLVSVSPAKSLNNLLGIAEEEMRVETEKRALGVRKGSEVWGMRREKYVKSRRAIRRSLDNEFRMSLD